MRLWSLHPRYLDARGLVSLWREALLARAVLEGGTKGYTHHPQLLRFRAARNPLDAIDAYLLGVFEESTVRGYHFDRGKFRSPREEVRLPVTCGQVRFEWEHLMGKLARRDTRRFQELTRRPVHPLEISLHPVFFIVEGDVASWERG